MPGFHLQGASTSTNLIWYIVSLALVDLPTKWIICQRKRRSCPVMVSYPDEPAVVLQTTMYSVLGAVLAMPMSTVSPANLCGQYQPMSTLASWYCPCNSDHTVGTGSTGALWSPAALLKMCRTLRNLNFSNWSSDMLLTDPDQRQIALSSLRTWFCPPALADAK